LSSMSLGLSSELSLSAWILALLPASAPAGWKINEFPSGSPSSSSAPSWKLCFLYIFMIYWKRYHCKSFI
ncbi:MAG: hypothetical protein PUD22_00650, partial [Erysipelotrichaceae bacterium]|nr:hypothetical protein [Erysipelotrichaceae bacterium]